MLSIDARITVVVLIPLAVVTLVVNLASQKIEQYREASRKAMGDVTDFIGEAFGAVQSVQVATAEERLVGHFRKLNEVRRQASVKDRLFSQLLESVFQNTATLGTGIVLLLSAQGMRSGAFTVGDFALFVYYLDVLTSFTGLIGQRWAWYKQVGGIGRSLGGADVRLHLKR